MKILPLTEQIISDTQIQSCHYLPQICVKSPQCGLLLDWESSALFPRLFGLHN